MDEPSRITIESTNGKLWLSLAKWLNKYPDGTGTAITVNAGPKPQWLPRPTHHGWWWVATQTYKTKVWELELTKVAKNGWQLHQNPADFVRWQPIETPEPPETDNAD